MTPFELHQPKSLPEAIALLGGDETARPMSGGTALMLMMKAGVLRPSRLVCLNRLGLDEIQVGPDGTLRVGSMVTLRTLEKSDLVRRGWPVIARTLRTLSNVRVRNVATVGGHLGHGDPHMDLPPVLSALGASVTVEGPKGRRSVLVERIGTGYLETSIAQGELITHLEVPPLGKRRAAYLKCTTRSADDWPALGVAVVVDQKDFSIVISAATDKPTRLLAAEKLLKGKDITDSLLKQAGDAAVAEVRIEGDLHGSAAYKQQLLRVYLGRTIHEARKPAD